MRVTVLADKTYGVAIPTLEKLPFHGLFSPFGPAPDVNVGVILTKPPTCLFPCVPSGINEKPTLKGSLSRQIPYLLKISGQSLTQSRRDAKPQRFLNENHIFTRVQTDFCPYILIFFATLRPCVKRTKNYPVFLRRYLAALYSWGEP